MANGWVKLLQCKSRAFEDVYSPSPKHINHPLLSSSCRKSVENLKNVVETTKKKARKSTPQSSPKKKPVSGYEQLTKEEPSSNPTSRVRSRSSISNRPVRVRTPEPFFPTLSELPEGHPSRNVVEIIFRTSWSSKAFSGEIEVIFKVQNLPNTIACFNEYREMVKSRAGSGSFGNGRSRDDEDNARCIADGNEVMRFLCLGHTSAGIYDVGGLCTFSGTGAAICTFSGSGEAHESAGGRKGRRAMLVCRVIAGRVCKRLGLESLLEGRVGYDSVSGQNGQLLVFDSRALLPCFLIVYKP